MLYISSRPKNLNSLPATEQDHVHQVLETLQEEGKLTLTPLIPPTFPQLRKHLWYGEGGVHVFHFDGHGGFGRLCPRCRAFNHSIFDRCQNKLGDGRLCQESLTDVDEEGYLSFEDEYGVEHVIRSEDLSNLMSRKHIRLAMLSACYSGTVDGHTLFGGTAQALIKQGVMSVVAPQLPISPDGAALFAHDFYEALAKTNSLLVAINRGRQSLMNHDNEWFIPAFYTRLGDHRLIDKVFPLA
jgi:hypothetical protein